MAARLLLLKCNPGLCSSTRRTLLCPSSLPVILSLISMRLDRGHYISSINLLSPIQLCQICICILLQMGGMKDECVFSEAFLNRCLLLCNLPLSLAPLLSVYLAVCMAKRARALAWNPGLKRHRANTYTLQTNLLHYKNILCDLIFSPTMYFYSNKLKYIKAKNIQHIEMFLKT